MGCVGSQESIPHCLRATFCGQGDWRFCPFLLSADPRLKRSVPDLPIQPFGLPLMKPLALQLWQGSIPGVCVIVLLQNLFVSLPLDGDNLP